MPFYKNYTTAFNKIKQKRLILQICTSERAIAKYINIYIGNNRDMMRE